MAATKTKPAVSEADKAKARSEAAKKAAKTRAINKAKKEAEIKAKGVATAKKEQAEVAEVVAAQPVKICDVICETLLLIRPGSQTEDRPKGEGYSYKECLEIVLNKVHKDAETSLDCLRWYATKMRGEGVVLPYRPRNAPVRKKVDPTE